MCNFWSAVLMRNGEVLWDPETSSHECIIEKYGLDDRKLKDRDCVRFEISPRRILGIASKRRSDWRFKLDEPETVPDWYANDERANERRCWEAWEAAMRQTLWKLNLDAFKATMTEIAGIHYLDMHAEPLPPWHVSRGWTWSAAWDAARDAVCAAAKDAAWDAAWAAAWAAARDAAWAAAQDAAWDAALLCICRLAPGLDPKHLAHAETRMEVWRRGWALLCDVDGKLYVYGKEARA